MTRFPKRQPRAGMRAPRQLPAPGLALLALALLALAPLAAARPCAASEPEPGPPGLADLAWLEGGRWEGSGLGGEVEESWSRAGGGTMLGLFRLTAGSETRVIEFMLITEGESGTTYRFKHFRTDYSTWEGEGEPLVFDLVRAEEGLAVFESSVQEMPRRLVYRRGEKGALVVTVEGSEQGQPRSFELLMEPIAE